MKHFIKNAVEKQKSSTHAMLEQLRQFENALEAELLDLELALELREQAIETRIKTLAAQWNSHALPLAE